jgi:hypothetical protein
MYFSDFGIRIAECGILKSAISDPKLRERLFSILDPGLSGNGVEAIKSGKILVF